MGPTLYNLKCTCVLLNCWDPWRFPCKFLGLTSKTIRPILISLLFYTLYTMGPPHKITLDKEVVCFEACCLFLVFWKLLLKGHWLYQVLYVLFFKWRNHTLLGEIFLSVIMCLLWSTEPIWYERSSVLSSPASQTLLTLPFG